MTLSEGDRRKLIGLLGRLGSDSAGERDNAAVAIERIRKDAGFMWDDMLGTQAAALPRPKPRQARPADTRTWREGSDEPLTGRTKVKKWFPKEAAYKEAIDMALLGCVTMAETSFVTTLEVMRREYGINAFLSEKQVEWLMALAQRATA